MLRGHSRMNEPAPGLRHTMVPKDVPRILSHLDNLGVIDGRRGLRCDLERHGNLRDRSLKHYNLARGNIDIDIVEASSVSSA